MARKKRQQLTERQLTFAVIGIMLVLTLLVYGAMQIPEVRERIFPDQVVKVTLVEKKVTAFCDFDNVCDLNENINLCPSDCIQTEVLGVRRSPDSPNLDDTTPTVIVTVQDPDGVQSCGVNPTDATQWACTVLNPGAVVTDVECTLTNYGWDGRYMLLLQCSDVLGNSIPASLIDDIIICADPLGCKR